MLVDITLLEMLSVEIHVILDIKTKCCVYEYIWRINGQYNVMTLCMLVVQNIWKICKKDNKGMSQTVYSPILFK